MTHERTPDAGDEANRELFISPSLIGESMNSPLLDQAIDNVSEQAIDNIEADRARKAAGHERPASHEAGGIVFAEGPEQEAEDKPE